MPNQLSTTSIQDARNTIRLENNLLQLDILPELGSKIWNLLYKPSRRQWIWHNPTVPPQKVSIGTSYDDHWAGGWEELFPNDAPGHFLGQNLPDHGEWWNQSWQWDKTELHGQPSIKLWREGTVTQTRWEKWITLSKQEAKVSVRYRITNLGSQALHFLFKQHLAVAVTPEHILELPGGNVLPVDLNFSTRIGKPGPFEWPHALSSSGEIVNLSILPKPEEQHQEFVYVTELPQGWCGVRHVPSGESLRMIFSPQTFPYIWLFMSFGGWQNLYTVVLEPCTNMPKDLNQALAQGRCAFLAPQQTLDSTVEVSITEPS